MAKLDITKGEWKNEGGDNSSIDIILENGATISVSRYDRYGSGLVGDRSEMEANAQLIADAGTTYNKCGLLPSELLTEAEYWKGRCAMLREVFKWRIA